MPSKTADSKDFSEFYLIAKERIDRLCEKIAALRITAGEAMAAYDRIEADFLKEQPGMADLFIMIYRSRVVRLCEQYLTGDSVEP